MNKQISKGLKRIIIIVCIVGVIGLIGLLMNTVYKSPEHTYWIITGRECDKCNNKIVEDYVNLLLPDYHPEIIDINSSEGAALRKEFDILRIPVAYFNLSIQDTGAFINDSWFNTNLVKGSSGYLLPEKALNSSEFIDKQAMIDNRFIEHRDDMIVLAINSSLVQYKPQIDFFMNPFDNQSNIIEEEMKYVYNDLKDNATFYPRFIVRLGNSSDCEYKSCSKNGLQELHEVARELCAYYKSGIEDYFNYAITMNRICSASDADNCWLEAVDDPRIIRDCYESDGRGIIIDERIVSTGIMNITSPTIYVNGIKYEGPINSSIIEKTVCEEYNIKPEACK